MATLDQLKQAAEAAAELYAQLKAEYEAADPKPSQYGSKDGTVAGLSDAQRADYQAAVESWRALRAPLAQAKAAYEAAQNAVTQAENANPDTNTTVSVDQQSNNTVVPSSTQQTIDDGSDPYVNTSTGSTTVSRQDVIDDGSDPYVSNGATTVSLPQTQQPVDDGSDPYVSNGQSTIPRSNPDTVTVTAAKNAQVKPAFDPPKDWRVRVSLAKSADYFYNLDSKDAGILSPLRGTGGVIFPYMPTIQVSYSAQYDSMSPTHSNYKIHNYQSSSVDNVTISGDFTAQDVTEANYLLAVIHFFRTASKMFYGQDQNPARGVPPPLLYLTGLGQYQFDHHPMVLTNFSYTLPQDVDYINAYPNAAATASNGISLSDYNKPNSAKPSLLASGIQRLIGSGLLPGGASKQPIFIPRPTGNSEVTRVPTKINISLTFLPIITRNAMSNVFNLKDYASGKLLRGSQNGGTGGGIW